MGLWLGEVTSNGNPCSIVGIVVVYEDDNEVEVELREDEECRVVLIAGEYEAGLNSTDLSLLDVVSFVSLLYSVAVSSLERLSVFDIVGINFNYTVCTSEVNPMNGNSLSIS